MALKILAGRVNLKPEEYEPLLKGTRIVTLEEALKHWEKADGLSSVYGSTQNVNTFNLKCNVYKESQDPNKYLDPSLTKALAPAKGE